MRYSINIYLSAVMLILISCTSYGQDDARAIYIRATDQLLSENMELLLEVDITDKKGRVKGKSFEVLVAKFGDTEKTKMIWQKPEAAKGTTVIFTEIPGKTGLIEVFTPSNGKIRKLKATQENMNLVGSEAKITSMTSRDPDELIFKLLGEEVVGGITCYNIEVKARENTDASRGVLTVESDTYRIVHITVFDKSGEKTSIVELSDYMPVDGYEHKFQPMRIQTEDFKNKKHTDMRVLKIASRADLRKEDFQLPDEESVD